MIIYFVFQVVREKGEKLDFIKHDVKSGPISINSSELNSKKEKAYLFEIKILKSEIKQIPHAKHDLKSSFRTLKNAHDNIKQGYRFDDEYAELKIKTIEDALKKISPHIQKLVTLYDLLEDKE